MKTEGQAVQAELRSGFNLNFLSSRQWQSFRHLFEMQSIPGKVYCQRKPHRHALLCSFTDNIRNFGIISLSSATLVNASAVLGGRAKGLNGK
ncbi:hypothetical protein [Enterobacter sp. 22466]|uniref:hypothetical protein n=1 Tax=Enterobacter sp. 22466 TaxID=3453924 RepID=UPI003F837DE3